MARERAVALFPIREYWMDIGQINDFKAVSHARGRRPFGVGTAMAPRRIGIVTGGRADWGLLLPVLRALLSTPDLELRLIVSGGHLSPRHGDTRRDIRGQGFEIAAEVPCLAEGDDPLSLCRNEDPARRLRQLGEDPGAIRVTGNPGLDLLRDIALLDRAAFEVRISMALRPRNLLVTYHPETHAEGETAADLNALLEALDGLSEDVGLILTQPNADPGHGAFQRRLEAFAARPNAVLHAALGRQGYFSAMRHLSAMVANSSSGLMEMPSFGKPTVNVGGRQDGRPRAASVIDVPPRAEGIRGAIKRARVLDYTGTVNP